MDMQLHLCSCTAKFLPFTNMQSCSALLLLIIFIALLLLCRVEGARLKVLAKKCIDDGSRCHASGRPWQHDGVCRYPASKKRLMCLAPESRKIKLTVIVRYRSLRIKKPTDTPVKHLYIRGSGPGLSWEKSIKMKKSAMAVDMWKAELEYTMDSDGLPCLSSTHCTYNQRALEFRVYTDEMGVYTMKGPNFYIDLPLSRSLLGAANFLTPEVKVHPWFHQTEITPKDFSMQMQFRLVGSNNKLKCSILYPPSFHENIRKHYPLVILLMPQAQSKYVIPVLEHMFVHEATVEEAVVVTVEADKRTACHYHPFYQSFQPRCKQKPPCHDCQQCWDPERSEPCDGSEFKVLTRKCLWMATCKGIGGPLLDGIQHEVIPKIMEMTAGRLNVNYPQNRVTIIGFGYAGVLACYAAITRPAVFGNAACLSPKFFLPIDKSLRTSHGIKDILKEEQVMLERDNRLRLLYATQKYYIDNGEHDDFFFPIADSFVVTDEVIKLMKKTLKLEEDVNIFRATIPGVTVNYMKSEADLSADTTADIIARLPIPFNYFLRPAGGPNKKFTRTMKLSESSYGRHKQAVQQNPDAVVIPSGGKGILVASNGTSTAPHLSGGIVPSSNDDNDDDDDEIEEESSAQCGGNEVPLPVFLGTVGEIK